MLGQNGLQRVIEKKMIKGLSRTLDRMGITEVGRDIPVAEILQEPPSFSGMGDLGRFTFRGWASQLKKRLKQKKAKVKSTPKGPVVTVKKSDVMAAALPWLKTRAKQMAKGVKKAVEKTAAVSTPAGARAVLPAAAQMRLQHQITREIMKSIPEAAVTGGRFDGLGDFLTSKQITDVQAISGSSLGGITVGAEEVADTFDVEMEREAGWSFEETGEAFPWEDHRVSVDTFGGLASDIESGAEGFGADIDSGAEGFGADIDQGAEGFGDFVTAGQAAEAVSVSGLGADDIETAAEGFGDFVVASQVDRAQAVSGLGADIDQGAEGFGDFVTSGQVSEAMSVSGLGQPAYDIDWPEQAWSYGGAVREARGAPTPQATKRVANRAMTAAMKIMKAPGRGSARSRVRGAVKAVRKLGVDRPKGAKAKTAGQAAFRPVMNGIKRFAWNRWASFRKRYGRSGKTLKGLAGASMGAIDGKLF